MHLYDTHCRHIFVGCSHDNGYARLLEEVGEPAIMNAITLVEGVPFEKELVQLKSRYHTTKFAGLFREEKIDIYNLPQRGPGTVPTHSNGLPPPSVQYQSPYQPTISPHAPSTLAQKPESTSNAGLNPTAPSWAATAKGPATGSPPVTPTPTSKIIEPAVPRNKYGERVDPVTKFDPTEVKRIKAMKMCNVHFLRDDCPWDPCTHDHYYKPNQNELNTLRYVSRLTPCKYGLECDEPKCIYGHRCPVNKDGEKGCRFGENCRFPEDAHGMDLRIVNTIKVGVK